MALRPLAEHFLDSTQRRRGPEELGFQASAVVKAITDLAPLLLG